MVKRGKKDNRKTPAGQAFQAPGSEANQIGASTPYDFTGKNLTASEVWFRSRRCWRSWSFKSW